MLSNFRVIFLADLFSDADFFYFLLENQKVFVTFLEPIDSKV